MPAASVAVAAEATAATEREAAPLSDLVNDEVGRADSWGLKVYMAFTNECTYKWGGKHVHST